MPKAVWNGVTIAESEQYELVEGNVYFPPESVNKEALLESKHHSHCPWKGEVSYYSILANGETNTDAAWYYPDPKVAANNIRGYIAFWKGVEVSQ